MQLDHYDTLHLLRLSYERDRAWRDPSLVLHSSRDNPDGSAEPEQHSHGINISYIGHCMQMADAYLQYTCYEGQRQVSELALLEAQHLHVQLVDEGSEYSQAVIAADVA